MHHLADLGYRAVSIDAFVRWLDGGPPLKSGDFVLTFDDGFLGVRDHALPVLEQLGWPFAVFLVTDLLGGADSWMRNDGTTGGQHPLLSVEDMRAMRQRGCSFHSHTRRHRRLPGLDNASLADELAGSRATLATLVGADDHYLAYPYGHVDDRVESAARAAGYKAAFSVQPGFNRSDVNPFRIRRLDVFGTDTPRMLLRKMQLGSNDGSLRGSLGYYWRRIARRALGWPR
jgi:peptidoglycan/xylan/chitin deacetylase (PgdA/CDA1 family)